MIQIYSPSNTDYEHNGDMVLISESCTISTELLGPWRLDLSHPIDEDGRWKYIEENAVIKVPTWLENKSQLYRIQTVNKTDRIIAQAFPIFYDAGGDFYIRNTKIRAKTAPQALQSLFAVAPSKYTYATTGTFTRRKSYEFLDTNGMSALETIRDQWRVEYIYDNNKLWVAEKQGTDRGVTVEYGKNITGVDYSIDMSDVVTRIYPYAYNGLFLTGTKPYVDSDLVSAYPTVRSRAYQFNHIKLAADATDEDREDETIIICDNQTEINAALREAVADLFATGIDKPKVSMAIDMLALEATEEYKGYSGLETIRLGDTVHCRHSKLGIVSDARVVGIVWDCALDRIQSVTLGEFAYDYFRDESLLTDIQRGLEQLAGNFNDDGTIMAERVRGILNGMHTQLTAQYTAADRTHKLAILFEDTDPSSPLYGALGIGTQGLQIADSVDAQGNWVWTTAITAKAGLLANIITGLIADATGYNYWDLDTGEFQIGDTIHVDDQDGSVVITATDTQDNETFYLNSSTGVVRIRATQFILSSGETLQEALSRIYQYSDKNLLSGSLDFDRTYWNITGTLNSGYSDPKGGNNAFRLERPSSGEAGITALSNNKPFPVIPGTYRLSVWLRSSTAASSDPIGIYLNNKELGKVNPTTKWKEYTFDLDVSSVSSVGWVNIGGNNTYTSSGSWTCYIYNPRVELVTSSYLTKENIFNQITDNGANNGVFMLENGEMYINFTYAHGGTLKLGGLNNANGIFKAYNSSGNEIVAIDNEGTKFCTTTGWAGENIRINENQIKGYVGDTLYTFIDLCANKSDGKWLHLEAGARSAGMSLAANNKPITLDAGTNSIKMLSNVEVGNVRGTGYLYTTSYVEAGDHVHTDGYVSCNTLSVTNPPWNSSSDRRLKKNIEDAKDQTENMRKLRLHSFDWKDGSGHVPVGLVAQELQEVYPELVKTGEKGLSIDYINMVPYLLKTMQEQEERIQRLEGLLDEQKKG